MDNSPILTYLYPTSPSPLQASANNASANGALNVVVSAQGKTIYATEIDIYVPVGKGADYLTSSVPVTASNTPRWTISPAQAVDQSRIPKGFLQEGVNYLQFSCFPQTAADQLLNFDLQFSFHILGVDSTPGPFTIGIGEYASTKQGPPGNPVFGSYHLTKAAPTFYLDNFTASATSGDVNVPLGGIPRNTPFYLSWESNGNQFTIYTAKGGAPVYKGENKQCLINGITQDTTFILQARTVGGAQSGHASGFETIDLYDSLTVTCSNPDLQPNSITNATTIVSTGDITSHASVVGKSATFGGLLVNGKGSMSSAEVGTTLHVYGNSTLEGGLVAQASTVQIFSTPEVIASGSQTYQRTLVVPTDGLIVGYCPNPKEYKGICIYWIFIVVAPVSSPTMSYQVGAQGGNTIGVQVSNPVTLTLPVRKGDKVTVYSTAWEVNNLSTTTNFQFFGMGGLSPIKAESFLDDSEAVLLVNPPSGA